MSLATVLRKQVALPLRRRLRPLARVRAPNGFRLLVDVRDEEIGRKLFLTGSYEEAFLRLLTHIDLAGKTAVDVGAHIGLYSVNLADLVGGSGRVYSFEPEARNFALLQRNLQLNGVSNVTAVRAAIGDRCETCSIQLSTRNFGDHRVAPARAELESVTMTMLDVALEKVPEGDVAFVKIDVQGYETFAIRGASRIISVNPRLILLIELSPQRLRDAGSSATELLTELRGLGFAGWEINDYRVSPIAEPWVYENIVGESEEMLLMSRDPEVLRQLLSRHYGTTAHSAQTPVAPGRTAGA